MTGDKIVELARTRIGNEYRLGIVVPKNNPNWHGPWDCAEFASWLVYQTTGHLYGCADNDGNPKIADAYTGFWARDARQSGRIEVGYAAQIAGAFILRVGAKVGHIVVSDGSGGTVEAKSRLYGVVEDTLHGRRWDMGILPPGIEYDKSPLYEKEPEVILSTKVWRLASPYQQGEEVRKIQRALQDRGFFLSKVDGVFGPLTHEAVVYFQKERNLVVDGEVGPQTLRALGLGG